MNYLAHAYLSFMHEEMMVGNMISDFVKGRAKFDYPPGIQKGITLHRSIDRFTDEHAATREGKQFFKAAVGLYAGAFMDVTYDHFLAIDKASWQEQSLSVFAESVYGILTRNYDLLPGRLQHMLPYMKAQNWFFGYQFKEGIEKSFEGVTRRAVYLNNTVAAFEAFITHYDALQQLSHVFISDVKKFARGEFEQLLKD
jgi:acyl carrier protein phosphodiesterase